MKKIVISICLFMICLLCILLIPKDKNNQYKNLKKQDRIKALININDLSDKFMEDYFNDYSTMVARNNLDNVLIVTSENGIKNSYGATDIISAPNNQFFLQYETDNDCKSAYKKLKKDGYVSVDKNETVDISGENTNNKSYMSWGIEAMGLDYAADKANNKNLDNVTVAVIDTGLNVDLFNEKIGKSKLSGTYNVLNNTDNVTDSAGHGTHVSGTIAEGTPNNVSLLAIKAGENSFSFTSEISAINYAVYHHADVINMSLGGVIINNEVYQAIEAAKQQNIIVVCGAGNNDDSVKFYPAAYDNTISVSGVDLNRNKYLLSNYGGYIDFTAPAVDIVSINGTKSGTSMATPHISAAVAIVKSYNKNLSLSETVDVLKSTTDDIGSRGWDQYFGYGLVNFKNNEFCEEGDICDKYNVFRSDKIPGENVVKIESFGDYIPDYNYGNITNIMNAKLKVYYNNEDYVVKTLGELDNITINEYNPNDYIVQNVIVQYEGKEATIVVDNTNNNISGWVYQNNDGKVTITKFLYGDDGPVKVYIPNKIDGHDVTALGDGLFEDNGFIKFIQLPETVVNIGNSAFKNSNFEIIDIKANSIDVGNYAFYAIRDLKRIAATINTVGDYAFANCSLLDNITLSSDIQRIGDYAFYNAHKLENINIPTTLNYIGNYAFAETSLNSVIIPAEVSTIQEGSFYGCYNLSELVISDGVKFIGGHAFEKTILPSISIPKTVESISSTSFARISPLESITVDSANNFYKSQNNILIENATNKIVVGTIHKVNNKSLITIPNGIKVIGDYAFANRFYSIDVSIPDGVEEIGKQAFYLIDFKKIVIPKSVNKIADDAFGQVMPDLVFWGYYDSYAMNYFMNTNNRNFKTIDPYEVNINMKKNSYNAFDSVDTTDMNLILKYKDKARYAEPRDREEVINSNYEIKYIDGQSLKYGDTYFTIETTTATGYKLSHNVEVNVSKIKPNYEVPTNIKGIYGQNLSSVILPSGFEWMNPNEIINNSETQTFKARYIPNDTNNYEIVEDIDITVSVGKQVINSEITISDKTYDGTNNVDNNLISISNIDSEDYTVTSATITNPNVGSKDAKVTIKLSDEKYLNYSFENNTQEKEFTVSMNVTPEKLLKPTLEDREYVYNGSEQEVSIINYDNNKMNISGNTRTKAGTQKITISLKNNNYIWEDGTSEDIRYDFIINKADINLVDNSKDVEITYDGNNHTIEYNVESSLNTSVKYMDTNGEYTLSEIPKYKDIGSYVVKYKVSIDDNYNDYYNEKTITIIIGDIVNNTVDYEGYFDNKEHTLDIKTSVSDYDIKYSNNTDYNLSEIPKYKDIGEYTINYKITKSGYNDLFGSNKVRIYGIKKFDSSIKVKNEMLITSDFSFDELIGKADVYANTVNYEHYNNNSELVSDVGIKTKDKIKIILNNDSSFEYSIVLLGDTDGDGEISYLDYVNVYNHIQKIKHPESNKKLLEKEYLQAADMSLDDEIDYMDYVEIYNKIKELKGGE